MVLTSPRRQVGHARGSWPRSCSTPSTPASCVTRTRQADRYRNGRRRSFRKAAASPTSTPWESVQQPTTHAPSVPGRCQNGRFASRRPAEEPAALDSTVELRSKHVVARSIGRWSVRRTLGSTASSSANASAPTANVTWTHGRDHPAGEEQLWTKLAEGLDATGGTQIKTYPHAGTRPRRPGSIRRTGSSST